MKIKILTEKWTTKAEELEDCHKEWLVNHGYAEIIHEEKYKLHPAKLTKSINNESESKK